MSDLSTLNLRLNGLERQLADVLNTHSVRAEALHLSMGQCAYCGNDPVEAVKRAKVYEEYLKGESK